MKLIYFLKLTAVLAGDKRMERKEINVRELEDAYGWDDDEDINDIDDKHNPNYKKEGMDIKKLNGDDHITTWSQSKKGQEYGLVVETVPGL